MSHWTKGKANLTCSVDQMARALVNIMPQWRNYIKVDESGQLRIHNYYTRQGDPSPVHIMVPCDQNTKMEGTPGVRYADMGLRKEEDGTWSFSIDEPYIEGGRSLKSNLVEEAMKVMTEDEAASQGYRTKRKGNKICVYVPVKEKHKRKGRLLGL